MTTYLLDSNVFIEVQRASQDSDLCSKFLDWLSTQDKMKSIDKVADEIVGKGDKISDWASNNSAFFLKRNNMVMSKTNLVSEWAKSSNYTQSAIEEFLGIADYWLVSHALAYGYTVVTLETSHPERKGKIKIPDACNGLKVNCMDPYEMLRKEGADPTLLPPPKATP